MTAERQIDVGAVIESQRPGWFQWTLVFWIALTMLVEGNDMQIVGYAAPAMISALHIDKASFGSVFGLGLIGYMLGALALCPLGDRIGRRRIVIAGVLAFGALTVAGAYATSLPAIIALRFLASLGLGSAIPSALALMVEYAPAGKRATCVSLMFVAYTVGGALGGLVAARWLPAHGWPVVFQIGGWTALAVGVALIWTLPESVRFLCVWDGRTPELARILRRLDPDLAIAPDARFVAAEESRSGVSVGHLFREGRAALTLLLWGAYVANMMTIFFMTSWLPTIINGAGHSLARAEVATALFQGGGAVGSLAFGWLLDRRGIAAVAAAFLVAAPVVASLGWVGSAVALLMVLTTLAGFLIPGAQAAINALSGMIYPTYIRSTGSGWAFGVGRIGSIVGPVIGGILLSDALPAPALFACVAAPALCSGAALYLLSRVAGARHPDPAARVALTGRSRRS